jgi:hypothetical protein
MPTIACHDDASYQSPINNFTCPNFQATDCTAWRFVGLNVTDLETLVDSCPISCGIDCGSLERFEIKLTFRIINVLNFLDSASVGILEDTSVEYLSNYVETQKPASKFFLYEAELTAQQIQASNSANRNLRRTQEEEPQYNDLIVTVAFRGLAIALGNAAVNSLIVQGIDSVGYSRAIQRSGDSTFLDIEVTSDVNDDSGAARNSTKKKGGGDGPSPGGFAAAVLMSFSLAGIGVGCYMKKRRTATKGSSQSIVKTREESEAQIFTGATGSPRSAPTGSVFEGNSGVVAGILRIMSSGSPRSNDSSTHSGQTSNQSSKESIPESADGTTSSQSEEEHPYTGLIPPMIVIDNLDETSPSSTKGGKNVFPYQRLHASSELVAALNGTSNAYDPSAFQGELYSQPLCAKSNSRSSSDRSRSFSPGRFNRLWDSDAEDGSVGPAITSSNTKDELEAILDQQQPLDTDAIAGAPVQANNGLRVTIDPRPASRGSNRSRDSPSRHQDSSPRSATSSRGNGNVSSPERERSFSDASTVLHNQHGGHSGEPPAPAEKLKEAGGFIQSFWHRSPAKAMTKVKSLTSLNGAASSDNTSVSHSRHGSKGSSLNDDDESVRHIFWAPRKGKLGLVVECKSSGGPVVVQVKDYSPLLGQVLRGDKIAKIDNVSTLHMTLAEVTNLLGGGGKSSYLRGPVIQFVVLRWPENNEEDDDIPNIPTANGSFENQSSPSIESMSQGGSFTDIFSSSDTLPTK